MSNAKTHGFVRRSQVPNLPGSKPKLCPRCKTWFAAFPRERVCFADRRAALKSATPRDTGTAPKVSKAAGHRGVKNGVVEVFSDFLNLTFRCPVRDPRASRLETIVSGYEEAARQRWGHTGHAPEDKKPCTTTMHREPQNA